MVYHQHHIFAYCFQSTSTVFLLQARSRNILTFLIAPIFVLLWNFLYWYLLLTKFLYWYFVKSRHCSVEIGISRFSDCAVEMMGGSVQKDKQLMNGVSYHSFVENIEIASWFTWSINIVLLTTLQENFIRILKYIQHCGKYLLTSWNISNKIQIFSPIWEKTKVIMKFKANNGILKNVHGKY